MRKPKLTDIPILGDVSYILSALGVDWDKLPDIVPDDPEELMKLLEDTFKDDILIPDE